MTVAEAAPAIKQTLPTTQESGGLAAFDMVCACLAPQRPELPDQTGLDLELLARVARRHQVSALVAARLAEQGREVPPRLARQAQHARQRAMRQLALSLDLADALNAAGIAYAFLKGLTLSQRAFGSPLLRSAVDIDLLVPRGAVAQAWQVLDRLGLARITPAADLSGARLALYCRASKDSIHHHPASGITVELHWRMSDELARSELPSPAELGLTELSPGRAVPVLDDCAQFLLLCTHGAAHGWARLKWLADVAALLHRSADGGAALWHNARTQGAAIPAASAILLGQELFGLTPPPHFAAPRALRLGLLLRLSRTMLRAGQGAQELEATRWRGWAEMLAKALVVTGVRGPIAVLRRLALSGEDVASTALPPTLYWLYPVLRVPLLVRRRLTRAQRLRRSGGEDNNPA